MDDEVRGSATGVRTLSWVVGGTDTDNREKIMACRIGFIKGGRKEDRMDQKMPRIEWLDNENFKIQNSEISLRPESFRGIDRPLSQLVKVLKSYSNKTSEDIYKCLGLKNKACVDSKLNRGSFSVEDIVKIADYCGFDIVIIQQSHVIMDDQISRQATLEALLDKGQHSRRYKLGDVWELNFDEIREVINALPAAGPQWTPCSKELPKKDGDYLVTTNNGQITRWLYIKGLSDEFWMSCVAAWMPMPKPYRQEEG